MTFRLPIFGPRTITETVPGITTETALAAGSVVTVARYGPGELATVRARDGVYCVPQGVMGCGKRKPRLLDLFCGAGGMSMGYHRAGYDVVGVDISPQKRYPFEFHQADAMTYPLDGFDIIHASPPCQRYSQACIASKTSDRHPDMIPEIRDRLNESEKPWVIENVPGAPMRADVILCGSMFKLELRRHRLFETNPRIFRLLPACEHSGRVYCVFGHGSGNKNRSDHGNVADWKRAMGIDWMVRDELSQAIPPAYGQWIGEQMMPHVLRAMSSRR